MLAHILIGTVLLIIFIWRFWIHRINFSCLLNLFLFPKKFIESSIKDAISHELKTNKGFKEHYESNNEKWKVEKMEEFQKQFSGSTKKLRNSIFKALITVFMVICFALGGAFILTEYTSFSDTIILVIQMVATFFILWALIGRLGWSIQTGCGETLPEDINDFWFIVLNIIGIFCLFFTQFYCLFKK